MRFRDKIKSKAKSWTSAGKEAIKTSVKNSLAERSRKKSIEMEAYRKEEDIQLRKRATERAKAKYAPRTSSGSNFGGFGLTESIVGKKKPKKSSWDYGGVGKSQY